LTLGGLTVMEKCNIKCTTLSIKGAHYGSSPFYRPLPARHSASPSSPSGGGKSQGRYNGLVRGKSLTSAPREDTAAKEETTLRQFLGQPLPPSPNGRKVILYARVSSRAQKDDLKNQVQALKQFCKGRGQPYHDVWTDIGSGLNFSTKAA
jgi:hypothetical protein